MIEEAPAPGGQRHGFSSAPPYSLTQNKAQLSAAKPRGWSLVIKLLPKATPWLPLPQVRKGPRMDPSLLVAGAFWPPTQGYLHTGIVGSIDFVSADGGHWHIAPKLGARGREEGQGVHATQRWADHNWGAQFQGIYHSCKEAAGDQLSNRGRGCCFLGAPQTCRDSGMRKTR